MRKLLKLLGKAPAVHRSVGKRPFLCLATETWGSVSERWSNLQCVVVTNRELWPVFMLGALSFLFRWGKGGGAREGEKNNPKLEGVFPTLKPLTQLQILILREPLIDAFS